MHRAFCLFFLTCLVCFSAGSAPNELERADLRIANYFTKVSRFQTRSQFESLLKKRTKICGTAITSPSCLEDAVWWGPVCSVETGRNQELFEPLWEAAFSVAKSETEALAFIDRVKNCSKRVSLGQRVAIVELSMLALKRTWPTLLKASVDSFDAFWKLEGADPGLSLDYLDKKAAELWKMKPVPVRVLRKWGVTVAGWYTDAELRALPFNVFVPRVGVMSKTLLPFGERILFLKRMGDPFLRTEQEFQRPPWLFEMAYFRCAGLRQFDRLSECLKLYQEIEKRASKHKDILDAVKAEKVFILVLQGQYAEAKSQLRSLLKSPEFQKSPSQPWAHYFLATIALDEGRFEESERELKRHLEGLRRFPQPDHFYFYGKILAVSILREKNDTDAARKEADKVKEEIGKVFSAPNDFSINIDLERLAIAAMEGNRDGLNQIETQMNADLREMPSARHLTDWVAAVVKAASGGRDEQALQRLQKALNADEARFLERMLNHIRTRVEKRQNPSSASAEPALHVKVPAA